MAELSTDPTQDVGPPRYVKSNYGSGDGIGVGRGVENTLSLPVSRKVREMIRSRRNQPASRLRRKDDSERATRCGKFLELLAEAVGNLIPPATALHSFASFGTKGAAKVCAHGECR